MRIDNKSVETHGRASVPPYRSPRSISSFVAGFKSSATKYINQYRETPGSRVWQSRFHDHIIRNNAEYQRIKEYIEDNPNLDKPEPKRKNLNRGSKRREESLATSLHCITPRQADFTDLHR